MAVVVAQGFYLFASEQDSEIAIRFFSTFHFLSSLHSFQVDVGNQIFVPARSHVLMNVEMIDDEFCFWSFLSKLGTEY